MQLYYAGFNTSSLYKNNGDNLVAIDSFREIPLPNVTDVEIGWGYLLIWQGKQLSITVKQDDNRTDENIRLICIPGKAHDSCKSATTGKDNIIVLSEDNEIWQYKFYENSWKKVSNFISSCNEINNEYPVKILQGGCTVVLTNLGRVFNVPTLVEIPKRVKFVDIACGFDHTVLLAENGDVYTMGMGTRGQLGHNDLEDSDNPRLIEALAGIKITEISAGGWHSAVVTDQGDLYTWGWNTNSELGFCAENTKVIALPTLIDFKNERGEIVNVWVKKVRCGNTFTICMADDGTLWGCGSNKYGQLGQSREILPNSPTFVKLDPHLNPANIRDFKCHEWGTVLITD